MKITAPPVVLVVLVAACLTGWKAGAQDGTQGGHGAGPALLSARAKEVTISRGAAAGYVDDQLCGACHQDRHHSFRDVGMSRSFYPPTDAELIEDWSAPPFFHQPSQRYYEMRRDSDGSMRFRRYQRDDTGTEINAIEIDIDWVLGSGNRSRTYLFQTEGGALFQLPVAWYTQEAAWRMAPGFDQPHHFGLNRPVQHECMFCHNAFPTMPEGTDAYLQPHQFSTDLPHGIGCQRCHGPGGAHVQHGFADQVDFKALAASIVNPADLDPARQRDVCYQCHMQPSVALMGIRRFGRNIYSYRPGQKLSDYLAHIDVVEDGHTRDERFEINHHPYRLEQSTCFQQSEGALSCLTCHDPHRKVPPEARVAHYRKACLSCHQLDDCAQEAMGSSQTNEHAATNDCAGCHMPQHRAQDVVHAVMTDHRITRTHTGVALVTPRSESTPVIVDAQLLELQSDLSPALGEVYRALTVLRAGGGAEAGAWLEKQLAKAESNAYEPHLDLARWRLRQGRFDEAARLFESLLTQRPGDAVVTGFLALAHAASGNQQEALARARESVTLNPTRAESHFNLGRMLVAYDQPDAGIRSLRRAAALRSNLNSIWFYLGDTLARNGQHKEAIEALRQALRVDPGYTRAYIALGRELAAAGERDQALRYLRHGAKAATDTKAVADLLARVETMFLELSTGVARSPGGG